MTQLPDIAANSENLQLDISSAELNELLKGIKIPPQPQVLVDIQMETAMPDCSLDTVAKLISKDVGLSGWVLKAVNSSYFGLRSKITSIAQAINLLGINSVVNIVNAISISDALSSETVTALSDFWDNAGDVASACAVISKKLTFASPDEAYTLGLFHDCGIPLLSMKYDNYLDVLESAYAQNQVRMTEIENQAFTTNHAVIGYFVAKSWKLPTYICEGIADHHKITEVFLQNSSSDSNKKNLLAVLKIAEHFCGTHQSIGKQENDYEFEGIKGILLAYLGISELDLDDMRDDLYDHGILHL